MKRKIVIVLKEDIVYYPPVLSIINVLLDLQYEVIHIGTYSDTEQKEELIKKGVLFFSTVLYQSHANLLVKFFQQLKFRRQVKCYLNQIDLSDNDFVWLMQAETICLLHALVNQYRCILHYFEYVDPKLNWKYRLLDPLFSMSRTINKAEKVVCCEYNRAQITKGVFQLDKMPYVLPNKPYIDESKLQNVPNDIRVIVNEVKVKTKGKKVILYQGLFLGIERRLEEFCQAVENMPDEYMLLAMGSSTPMYEELKQKYASKRIVFLPFIRPPYHLLITRLASIGILSYFPRPYSISSVLNPLYCAPNKIFEYAKYAIPMISNDIPGLSYIYLEYKCGECVPYPMSALNIERAILKIFGNYEAYSKGAISYYNSVNLQCIIMDILSEK